MTADSLTQQAHRRSGMNGSATELTKIGTNGLAARSPKRNLQRLHRTVVHRHVQRDSHVDPGGDRGLGDPSGAVLRHVEPAAWPP